MARRDDKPSGFVIGPQDRGDRSRFSAIFPNEKVGNEQVSDSILSTLKTEKTLGCSKLG